MPLSAVRREAIELLCAAQEDGRLSGHVFEERLAAVQQATSDAAIEAIVADLRESWTDPELAPAEVDHDPPPVPYAEQTRLTSVLATTRREGNWVVPYRLEVLSVLGEMQLDFRDAYLPERVIDVHISATLGSVHLTVPKGTEVQNEVEVILAEVSQKRKGKAFVPPNGLVLRISGRALLSSIEIRER
jgi:hypothetical protein